MTTLDTATSLDTNATLGDLVTAHPELAQAFERQGLDYCCGGSQTLGDACAALGLDARAVLEELTSHATDRTEAPWASMGLVQLVDHIESTHHKLLWDQLARLGPLTAKIAAVHGQRHPELAEVERSFAALRAELEPHLKEEEQIVFPAIRELTVASHSSATLVAIGQLVASLEREHDVAGEHLAKLRTLTRGYTVPADGCASYTACYAELVELEADLHLHVHKENNVLFPAVRRVEHRLTHGDAGEASDTKPDLDTRVQIHDVVVAFYREIVFDELLAPVFAEVAETDWAIHIPKLIDFWCRMLLDEPGYDGFVLGAHARIHQLGAFQLEHFDRWFALWVETIDSRWSGPYAEKAKDRAERIGHTLCRRLLDVDWTPCQK